MTEEMQKVNAITQKIKQEQSRLAQLNDWIQRITQELTGITNDQEFKGSSMATLIAQKVDCERRIEALKIERAEARADLTKRIDEMIEDNAKKTILIERYCFGETWKKIAEKLHITENWVFALHRNGLKEIKKAFNS